MIRNILLLIFSLQLLLPVQAADAPPGKTDSGALTNHVLQPGPDGSHIAYLTARVLEGYHYTKHRFDASISSKFLDEYVNTLDPRHMHFLQSDIAEFEHYRTNLNRLMVAYRPQSQIADVRPAYEIFNRFL